jgi:glycosyltransferase involved in cell wall biosynthesis
VPWTERPDLFLSAADSLLLPSRWEGLPLTMLEAMAYGLPILASDIDIFRLYLPPAHIVDFEAVDLGEALPRLVDRDAIEIFARHAAARLAPLTLENAQRRFVAALSDDG